MLPPPQALHTNEPASARIMPATEIFTETASAKPMVAREMPSLSPITAADYSHGVEPTSPQWKMFATISG